MTAGPAVARVRADHVVVAPGRFRPADRSTVAMAAVVVARAMGGCWLVSINR
jgi:hypothetical protein